MALNKKSGMAQYAYQYLKSIIVQAVQHTDIYITYYYEDLPGWLSNCQ